jgi:hypothetical protein
VREGAAVDCAGAAGVQVMVGDGVWVGTRVGISVGVGGGGVRVGREVGVMLGVGVWYQGGVGEGVRVGAMMGVGVTSTSGG